MDKKDTAYAALLSLMAEMVLDESIRKHREVCLYREIDRALASGDEALFLELTSELRTLLSSAS
ncbi:IDEAL domain-containing protein [Paenibacillus thermoaerophilus]|uniref:IDEAL domain-containing protein n=1 Tax=Paenibacillus thermoaerophilus TaxID=1215385 RepID=A0ABW2V2V7_9BACL|nr:IDEAL domain-containing protein [Paenibacillus thermoaerophilus]TMV18689.1 IDEAL domain-containing protein [Paenibacillus thermoaerophilus]